MDDTMLIFACESDADKFHAWMNLQHQNISFTIEKEANNRLAFLDVLIIRSVDGTLLTSVYRKPSFSGLYLRWTSFVPKSFKRGVINCLLFRAWKLCTDYDLFHKEVLFIKDILMANGYPANFIESCVHKFIDSKINRTITQPVYGPDKKRLVLTLPFCGTSSLKLKRQLRRMINAVAPWMELFVVSKPIAS